MLKLLLIALGGAAGTLARYGTSVAMQPFTTRHGFPIGTLAVNLVGCLLIGILGGVFLKRGPAIAPELQLMLTVGFLGGFTTFSSFALESANMLLDGRPLRAAVYVLVSNVVGISLALGGFVLARRYVGS